MRSGTIAFLLGACVLHGLEVLPGLWTAAMLPLALYVPAANRLAAVAGLLAAGFLWALVHAHATLAGRLPAALEGVDLVVTGRIASIPAIGPRRTRFDLVVENGIGRGARSLRLSWYRDRDRDPPALVTGEIWRLVVRLRTPRGLRNPGGFDYETWLFERGYAAQGYVRSRDPRVERVAAAHPLDPGRLRHALSRRLREIPGLGPAGVLIEALTVGVRDRIGDDQREVLRRTGTSHLLAISGLHVGLAAGLGFAAARLAGPWLVPWMAPLRLGAVTGIAVAGGYAALAGFSIPTRRALVMTTVLLLALCARRRLPAAAGLCLGLAAVLVLQPSAVLASGFWLSFTAVAMLLYGMGGRPHAGGSVLHWRRWGLPQMVVTVGLAPLVLHWFGEQPVVGPMANAIAIPWVGVAVLPVLLAGVLCLSLPGRLVDPLGDLLVTAGARGLDGLWVVLESLASHGPRYALSVEPSVATTVLAMIGAAIMLAPPGVPGRWAGALWFAPLLWWSPALPEPGEIRTAFLDVGHGLAVVVETRDRVLVYDTGPAYAADVVLSYLAWRGRRRIDTVVVSHADSDHRGGYAEIARRQPIGEVLANEGVPGASSCLAGRSWEWNGIGFEVLHPPSRGWRGNDGSCVLRITAAGGRSILLTGDVEARAERSLVERAADLRADLLVAPHHGSRTSSGAAFLDATGGAPRGVLRAARQFVEPPGPGRSRALPGARGHGPSHGSARRDHRHHPAVRPHRPSSLAGGAASGTCAEAALGGGLGNPLASLPGAPLGCRRGRHRNPLHSRRSRASGRGDWIGRWGDVEPIVFRILESMWYGPRAWGGILAPLSLPYAAAARVRRRPLPPRDASLPPDRSPGRGRRQHRGRWDRQDSPRHLARPAPAGARIPSRSDLLGLPGEGARVAAVRAGGQRSGRSRRRGGGDREAGRVPGGGRTGPGRHGALPSALRRLRRGGVR